MGQVFFVGFDLASAPLLITVAHIVRPDEGLYYFIDPLTYDLVGPLEIVAFDKKSDIAVLRAKDYEAKSFFSIDEEITNSVKLSDKLISVGFPAVEFHVKEGIFQGINQEIFQKIFSRRDNSQDQFMTITGMRSSGGHSGGPVLSESGVLLGMLLGGSNSCDKRTKFSSRKTSLEEKSLKNSKCDYFACFVTVDRIRDVLNEHASRK